MDIDYFGNIDKEFNMVIDDLNIEEELLQNADMENLDSRITTRMLNFIVNKMRKVRVVKDDSWIVYTPYSTDKNRISITLSKGQIMKETLDFFKTIDMGIYLSVLRLYVGISENEELKIYNYHRVDDFDSKDTNGYSLFEKKSVRLTDKGKSKIYLVLMEDLNKEDASMMSRLISSNEVCSYVDLFKLVHEVAHGFDKDFGNRVSVELDGENKNEAELELPKMAETFLAETTAIFFEHLLGDYLINKTPSNKLFVKQILQDRITSSGLCVDLVGLKTSFMIEKKEKGFVSDERISDIASEYGLTCEEAKEIILESPLLYEDRKYALAYLFVPTMIKKYKEDGLEKGNKRVLSYLDAVRNNDFDSALSAFDISLDKDGLNVLLSNLKEYEKSYLVDYDFEDLGGR